MDITAIPITAPTPIMVIIRFIMAIHIGTITILIIITGHMLQFIMDTMGTLITTLNIR